MTNKSDRPQPSLLDFGAIVVVGCAIVLTAFFDFRLRNSRESKPEPAIVEPKPQGYEWRSWRETDIIAGRWHHYAKETRRNWLYELTNALAGPWKRLEGDGPETIVPGELDSPIWKPDPRPPLPRQDWRILDEWQPDPKRDLELSAELALWRDELIREEDRRQRDFFFDWNPPVQPRVSFWPAP